jgi:hypothetical protein
MWPNSGHSQLASHSHTGTVRPLLLNVCCDTSACSKLWQVENCKNASTMHLAPLIVMQTTSAATDVSVQQSVGGTLRCLSPLSFLPWTWTSSAPAGGVQRVGIALVKRLTRHEFGILHYLCFCPRLHLMRDRRYGVDALHHLRDRRHGVKALHDRKWGRGGQLMK